MRLHQFSDDVPPSPTTEDDDEIDATGAELVRSLRTIAGRLQQFIEMMNEEQAPALRRR